jgi:cell pole-organizing protein PopZ
MATASSVQREPSMEEILASIRRIIEDSDTGRKQPEDAAELRQDAEPVEADQPEAEVTMFRSEFHAVPETKKPFTLADVQARMAAEQRNSEQRETPAYEPASLRPTLALADTDASAGDETLAANAPVATEANGAAEGSDTIVADWRRDIAAAGHPVEVSSPVQTETSVRLEPEFESDIEIFEEELTTRAALPVASVAEADYAAASEEPKARPAIVSEHTGRQVAAAFGELSEAFATRSKKTFDDMAEQMLRPMLQDWLDNNLPTLVERLVREEIERVARGA